MRVPIPNPVLLGKVLFGTKSGLRSSPKPGRGGIVCERFENHPFRKFN